MGTFMRRVRRVLDWRFVVALTVMMLVASLCWGFIQRVQQADALLHTSQAMVDQVDDLKRQLATQQRASARRSKAATAERDELQRQLTALLEYLREHGLTPPTFTPSRSVVPPKASSPRSVTASVRRPHIRSHGRPPRPSTPSRPASTPSSSGGSLLDTLTGTATDAARATASTADRALATLGP